MLLTVLVIAAYGKNLQVSWTALKKFLALSQLQNEL
jgi:hypothetical protein